MTTTTTQPTVIPCLPWCVHGGGFRPSDHPDDRYCTTGEDRTVLSMHPPERMSDGTWEADYVTVYPQVWVGSKQPSRVHLGQGDSSGPRLTAQEARSVARALIAAAELIESGAR